MDLRAYWLLFARNWRRIILAGIIAGAAVWAVNRYLIKPTYSSRIILYFGRITDGISDARQNGAYMRYGLNIGSELIRDYCELLKTKRFKREVNDIITQNPDFHGEKFSVEVSVINKTRLLSLEILCHNPQVSKIVADAYATVFVEEVKNILNIQNSQVVDQAEVPSAPIKPRIYVNTALGLIGGIVLMYLFCFLRSLLDVRIKTPEQMSECLDLPVLGVIPEDERFSGAENSGHEIAALEETSYSESNIAEAFHSLRVNLQYDDIAPENGAKVLLVTSSLPSEGKSFISSNLAVSLAGIGKKVLLINCDLRKPALQKVFDQQHKLGIVNILVGEKTFDDAVVRNVFNLPLDVLFCGPTPPNPSKLLGIEKFGNLLSEQKKNYDYIICDAPPVLLFSDAAVIGNYADGAIMVVRANSTTDQTALNAIRQLKQNKLNIIGAVMSRFVPPPNAYGGYSANYSYGYNYNCGYSVSNSADSNSLRRIISKLAAKIFRHG